MTPLPLPGEELVEKGLRDLEGSIETVEALLVSLAAPRLRALGVRVSAPLADPEERLYRRLTMEHGDGAHARYNALVRRLVSYERAVACAS